MRGLERARRKKPTQVEHKSEEEMSQSKLSCIWTSDMVDSLIDVYADKASKAGKAADNGSLTSQQWSEVEKELNKRSETQLSKQQIQSKKRQQL